MCNWLECSPCEIKFTLVCACCLVVYDYEQVEKHTQSDAYLPKNYLDSQIVILSILSLVYMIKCLLSFSACFFRNDIYLNCVMVMLCLCLKFLRCIWFLLLFCLFFFFSLKNSINKSNFHSTKS